MCADTGSWSGGQIHPSPRFKDSSNPEHQKSYMDPLTLSTISVPSPLPNPLCALLHHILRTTCSYAHFIDKETEAGSRSHSSWRQSWDSYKICFGTLKCVKRPAQTGVCGHVKSRRMFQKLWPGPQQLSVEVLFFGRCHWFLKDCLCRLSFPFPNSAMRR